MEVSRHRKFINRATALRKSNAWLERENLSLEGARLLNDNLPEAIVILCERDNLQDYWHLRDEIKRGKVITPYWVASAIKAVEEEATERKFD